MLIRLVWVGKIREPAAASWIEDYRRRIARHCPVAIDEVKDASGKGAARAAREARALLSRIGERSLVVLLDEKGREMTSEEFASFLGSSLALHPEVCFVLGGPEGLGAEVFASAGVRLSLSRLTMAHEMARVVLMEQIYRAFGILKGTPYHR